MKYLILILFLYAEPSDSLKVDTCKSKLSKIQYQQKQLNEKLDSLMFKLNIDTVK